MFTLDQTGMQHKLPDAQAWVVEDIKRRNRHFMFRYGAMLILAVTAGTFIFVAALTAFMPD
jgi:hypothetical protein